VGDVCCGARLAVADAVPLGDVDVRALADGGAADGDVGGVNGLEAAEGVAAAAVELTVGIGLRLVIAVPVQFGDALAELAEDVCSVGLAVATPDALVDWLAVTLLDDVFDGDGVCVAALLAGTLAVTDIVGVGVVALDASALREGEIVADGVTVAVDDLAMDGEGVAVPVPSAVTVDDGEAGTDASGEAVTPAVLGGDTADDGTPDLDAESMTVADGVRDAVPLIE